jgi:hypothetical protein
LVTGGTGGSTGSGGSDPRGGTGSAGGDPHGDPRGNTGSAGGDPSGDPKGGKDWIGGAGAPPDPIGQSGSGNPYDPPPVTHDNLLGLFGGGFLHGGSGPTTGQGNGGSFSPDIVRGLTHELTGIGGSGVDPWIDPWTSDGSKDHGIGTTPDVHGHGSVGGLEEDGKPHHTDLWKPGHH